MSRRTSLIVVIVCAPFVIAVIVSNRNRLVSKESA